ncbi:uncharacterized protein A4U43_C08F8730 [Asparagus officinalis]|nr:uncharacterized protein A4U43_C08F8730 [Asparagus officinalis]
MGRAWYWYYCQDFKRSDGCSGNGVNRDYILRDERRLTELGRRTLEIFILAHIFSGIEIAYQEAVALKRQEELIREEEEAELAENEKREKRAKKKQARQRRNNSKGKGRGKVEKAVGNEKEKHKPHDSLFGERILEDFSSEHGHRDKEKSELREEVSDVSDPGDEGVEGTQPDVEDRDTSPLNWDTNTSGINPAAEACRNEISNGHVEKKSLSFMDDSSSTCSTDSVPSVVVNGPYKGYSSPNNRNKRTSSNRGKNQQNRDLQNNLNSRSDCLLYVSGSCSSTGPGSEDNLHPLKDQTQKPEQPSIDKEEIVEDQIDDEIPSDSTSRTTESVSSCTNPSQKPSPVKLSTEHSSSTTKNVQVSLPEPTSNTQIQSEKSVQSLENLSIPRAEALKHTSQAMSSTTRASSMSRPSSTPVVQGPKTTVPLVTTSQAMPSLSRALSSLGHLDSELSFLPQSFEPQSYRNVIMGIKTITNPSTSGLTPRPSLSSSIQTTAFSQPSSSSSSSSFQTSVNPGIALHNQHRWNDHMMPDEFPHLDIINDLLDEDHRTVGRTTLNNYHQHDDFHSVNQQYCFTTDIDSMNASFQFGLSDCYYDELSQMIYDCGFNGFGMDSLLQSQWPINSGDLSVLNINGYAYPLSEYSARGLDGYNMMYQRANGL